MVEPKHIRQIRDSMAATPGQANSVLKSLRLLFAYGTEARGLRMNPAREIRYFSPVTGGWHSWTDAEIEKFRERHASGTRARLAFELLFNTVQRKSDVIRFGRQHIKGDLIALLQYKNRKRAPVQLEIPLLPELQSELVRLPKGQMQFVVTAFGKPFTSNGFGNRFRKWCDEAGLPNCSAHGLRKATATRLAEAGCTEHEIMAITGHRTSKEVSRYTRAANQKVLAARAFKKLKAKTK